MAKITFIREESNYYNNSKQTVEFSAVELGDIVEQFEYFLKGAGFVFDGHLQLVDEFQDTYTDVNKDINEYRMSEQEEIDIRS